MQFARIVNKIGQSKPNIQLDLWKIVSHHVEASTTGNLNAKQCQDCYDDIIRYLQGTTFRYINAGNNRRIGKILPPLQNKQSLPFPFLHLLERAIEHET